MKYSYWSSSEFLPLRYQDTCPMHIRYSLSCVELGLRWLHDRIDERARVSATIKRVVKRHPKLARALAK